MRLSCSQARSHLLSMGVGTLPGRLLTSKSLRVAAPMRRERNRKSRACSGPSCAPCACAEADQQESLEGVLCADRFDFMPPMHVLLRRCYSEHKRAGGSTWVVIRSMKGSAHLERSGIHLCLIFRCRHGRCRVACRRCRVLDSRRLRPPHHPRDGCPPSCDPVPSLCSILDASQTPQRNVTELSHS
jgi:hypothetical protein